MDARFHSSLISYKLPPFYHDVHWFPRVLQDYRHDPWLSLQRG